MTAAADFGSSGGGVAVEADPIFVSSAPLTYIGNLGNQTMAGRLTVGGGVRFGTDVFSSNVGQLYKTAAFGTVLTGVVGSDTDFTLAESGGIALLTNPAGTNNVNLNPFFGNTGIGLGTTAPTHRLSVAGGIVATSSATAQSFFSTNDVTISSNTKGVILYDVNASTQGYRIQIINGAIVATKQ